MVKHAVNSQLTSAVNVLSSLPSIFTAVHVYCASSALFRGAVSVRLFCTVNTAPSYDDINVSTIGTVV